VETGTKKCSATLVVRDHDEGPERGKREPALFTALMCRAADEVVTVP
jgi:hypothetical protein